MRLEKLRIGAGHRPSAGDHVPQRHFGRLGMAMAILLKLGQPVGLVGALGCRDRPQRV
jgi:hypothetical protein